MAGHPVRRRTLVLSLIVSLLALTAVGLFGPRNHPPASCLGSADLCDLRLDQVALATTHNSMAAAEEGFAEPSQTYGIAEQLEAGIRGFLVDAWLGPDDRVYLCHEDCERGAVLFSEVVGTWRNFLEENPGEVLVVIVQDELPADLLREPLADLSPYLARIDPAIPLPTLGAMVASGHRVLLGLENGDLGPTVPNVYAGGLVQEVRYDYRSAEALASGSCRPNRGEPDAPLFLLNHWVTPASEQAAAEANTTTLLVERATICAQERGQPVNLVAVDFADIGGVAAAVTELNDAVSD